AGARRKPACGRRHREERDARGEHGPRPDQVTQPARGDDQDGQHESVGVDDPEDVVERRVQPREHVGDRDVDDRPVEQGHEEPERDDQQPGPWVATELFHGLSLACPPPERPTSDYRLIRRRRLLSRYILIWLPRRWRWPFSSDGRCGCRQLTQWSA